MTKNNGNYSAILTSPNDENQSESKSLLSKLRSRLDNQLAKNQQLTSEQSTSHLQDVHLNNIGEHRLRRHEYQKSSLGQLGVGSLRLANDHDKELILDRSRKIQNIESFKSMSNSSVSQVYGQIESSADQSQYENVGRRASSEIQTTPIKFKHI